MGGKEKKVIAVTLDKPTLAKIELICKYYGLKRSQAMTYCINSIANDINRGSK